VRAGRMTQEQAANHPSRNVISRALGAEDDVEVDLKTIEVEDGTAFLLCSDGITRHLPDDEIREILATEHDLEAACVEMKKRCFERGAEDNLTAVVVRVGEPLDRTLTPEEVEERTMASARPVALAATLSGDAGGSPAPSPVQPLAAAATAAGSAQTAVSPTTRQDDVVGHAATSSELEAPGKDAPTIVVPERARRGAVRSVARAIGFLLLVGVVAAAAFYGGMFYQKRLPAAEMHPQETSTAAAPVPTPADPEIEFEKQRREVDKAPAKMAGQMASENNGKPLESTDPQFLYLYGRALMLTGKPVEASDAFKKAIEKIRERPARDPLKVETKLSWAAAALKTGNWATAQAAAKEIDEVIELENKASAGSPLPGGSGAAGTSTASKSPVSP
jgi:Stage II sporulation protein E (SpoIIE)